MHNNINFKIYFLILMFLLTSCYYIQYKGKFKEFSKNEPYINNKLKLDGYYYYEYMGENIYGDKIPLMHSIILYKDGTIKFCMNFSLNIDKEYKTNTPFFIKHREFIEYINDLISNYNPNEYQTGWGHYITKDDSLIFLFYWDGPSDFRDYYLYEGKGIIMNDTTFVLNKIDSKGNLYEIGNPRIYKFRKYSPKPDSTNWTQKL